MRTSGAGQEMQQELVRVPAADQEVSERPGAADESIALSAAQRPGQAARKPTRQLAATGVKVLLPSMTQRPSMTWADMSRMLPEFLNMLGEGSVRVPGILDIKAAGTGPMKKALKPAVQGMAQLMTVITSTMTIRARSGIERVAEGHRGTAGVSAIPAEGSISPSGTAIQTMRFWKILNEGRLVGDHRGRTGTAATVMQSSMAQGHAMKEVSLGRETVPQTAEARNGKDSIQETAGTQQTIGTEAG